SRTTTSRRRLIASLGAWLGCHALDRIGALKRSPGLGEDQDGMLVADSVRNPVALVGIIIEPRHLPLALTPRADHPHWCILHEATLGSGVTGRYQAFPLRTPWKFPRGHIGAPPPGERTCAGPALALLMSGDGAARRQSGGNHGRIARHRRRDRAA